MARSLKQSPKLKFPNIAKKVTCRRGVPTKSISTVRKHFWTEVARDHGGASSPTKKGLNGTMPALVDKTHGWGGIRLAQSTGIWPGSGKNGVNGERRWGAVIPVPEATTGSLVAQV